MRSLRGHRPTVYACAAGLPGDWAGLLRMGDPGGHGLQAILAIRQEPRDIRVRHGRRTSLPLGLLVRCRVLPHRMVRTLQSMLGRRRPEAPSKTPCRRYRYRRRVLNSETPPCGARAAFLERWPPLGPPRSCLPPLRPDPTKASGSRTNRSISRPSSTSRSLTRDRIRWLPEARCGTRTITPGFRSRASAASRFAEWRKMADPRVNTFKRRTWQMSTQFSIGERVAAPRMPIGENGTQHAHKHIATKTKAGLE